MSMTPCAPAQNLFVSSFTGNTVYQISPGGKVSTFVTGITSPSYMAFNGSGNLFVGSGSSIIEVTPGGVKSTFATGLVDIGGLAFDSAGDLFVSDSNVAGLITEFTPGGAESTFATGLDQPRGLAFNNAGNLFVGTGSNIMEITSTGTKSVFLPGLALGGSLIFNNAGDLYAEYNQQVVEIAPDGTKTRIAIAGDFQQIAINDQGILFVADPVGNDVIDFNSSGTRSTFASGLGQVEGLAFAVPEPLSGALVAVGLAAFFMCRRMERGRISKPHKL